MIMINYKTPYRIRPIAHSNTVMNKLLKIVFSILFILPFAYKSFGQRALVPVGRMPIERQMQRINKPAAGRKIEIAKENYIGIRMRFTHDEAKAFWPLYHQYVQDLTAVRILRRQNNSSGSPDGQKQIELELQYETELVNIRKRYRDEFLKILPPEKLSELYKSEHDFNDEVVKQLGERPATQQQR